jgi:hypothetical protein
MTRNLLITLLAILVVMSLFGYRSAAARAERARRISSLKDKPPVTLDFTTPEGAVLMLEDAFRRRDLAAAVAAKDFATEAELELQAAGSPEPPARSAIDARAADLEGKFRTLLAVSWPDFSAVTSYFVDAQPYIQPAGHLIGANLIVVTEINRFAQGGYSEQRILVCETPGGWRVLNPLT